MSEEREKDQEEDANASDPPNNTVARVNLTSPEPDAAPSDPPNNT